MDHEPMHLYQALQGLMVVVTRDYTKATLGCKLILFQLLGVPYLNQRAREVPPAYHSLTSSGVYLLLTKKRAFFWLGSEFYRRYVFDLRKGSIERRKLVSDGLFMRMLHIYRSDDLYEDESEVDFGALFEQMLSKAEIMVEGEETTKFKKYIKGKINDEDDEEGGEDSDEADDPDEEEDEEDDDYLLKYESPFVKRVLLPQDPRLFCLLYNGNSVEYDTNLELA